MNKTKGARKKKYVRKKVAKRPHIQEQRKPKMTEASEPVFPAVIADLQAREKQGIKKYGQALHTDNGRDALIDAYQEALDLCLYLKQRLLEDRDLIEYVTTIDSVDIPLLNDWVNKDVQEPIGTAREMLANQAVQGSTEDRPCAREFMPRRTDTYVPIMGIDTAFKRSEDNIIARWAKKVGKMFNQFEWVTQKKNESVLEEAQRLVHGDRGENYGHPFDDFGRTAGMVTALLGNRLVSPLTQEDVAKIMICVKLSRETNQPKRDNRVDIAGYVETLDMVVDERARREVR